MLQLIYLLRPHHYLKNTLIFAPLLFSFAANKDNIINTIIAFILFSLMASSVYIFNDIMDIKEDRNHPSKKKRPIARGVISKSKAIYLVVFFTLTVGIISLFLNLSLFIVLFIYFILNIIYSIKLKHYAIIDIIIIASGFVLRLFAGSVVTGIELSKWIITMTFLLALFVALAKRRNDIVLSPEYNNIRRSIDGYSLEFINISMTLMAAVVIVSYIIYTLSSDFNNKISSKYLYFTTLFVIAGIMRYMQITFVEKRGGSPIRIFRTDLFLIITIVLWFVSFIFIAFQ